MPNDTLSVSGYAHVLFPLTKLLPASPQLDDLYYAKLNYNKEVITDKITVDRPNYIYLSKRDKSMYYDLKSTIENLGIYTILAEIPIDKSLHYGQFSAVIYKLIN